MRQTVVIQIDANLLLLLSDHSDTSHTFHRAQTVLQLVHVVAEFAVGLVLRLHRNEHRRRVSEVIVHLHGQHTLRQLSFERLHTVLEFRPELVLVLDVIVQFYLDDGYRVAAVRLGLHLVHVLVGEDVFLQGLRHLLLHLQCRGAWINGYHHALTDGDVGELVLPDAVETIETKGDKHAGNHDDYLPVVHRPLYEVHFIFLCHCLPSFRYLLSVVLRR